MKRNNPSVFRTLRIMIGLKLSAAKGIPYCGKLMARLFAGVVRLKGVLYRLGFLREKREDGFVISVGNVVLGGTGKTQVVLWLLEKLEEVRDKAAVLSRGYRGRLSSVKRSLQVDLGKHTAVDVGDEPYLMSGRLGSVPVIIGKNRLKSARLAKSLDRSLLILDDGLQYRKLRKHFNIIVVNGKDPFGGEKFFPEGRLRDFVFRLKEADFIIVNGDYDADLERRLDERSRCPKIFVRPTITEIIVYQGGKREESLSRGLPNTPVGVFCGLGNPQNFVSTVERCGGIIVDEYFLPDHQKISCEELSFLSARTKNRLGKMLICSEKDFVKIQNDKFEAMEILPVGVLRTRLETIYNHEAEEEMLCYIREKIEG